MMSQSGILKAVLRGEGHTSDEDMEGELYENPEAVVSTVLGWFRASQSNDEIAPPSSRLMKVVAEHLSEGGLGNPFEEDESSWKKSRDQLRIMYEHALNEEAEQDKDEEDFEITLAVVSIKGGSFDKGYAVIGARDCPGCGIQFIKVSVPEDPDWRCLKCNQKTEVYKGRGDVVCINEECSKCMSAVMATSNMTCPEKLKTGKGFCHQELFPVTRSLAKQMAEQSGAEQEDKGERLDSSLRALKSYTAKVQSFISSSGTHHRSKGGSKTSSQSEMHSAAHRSKKIVRERYARTLQVLIDKAKEKGLDDDGIVQDAESMIGAILAK